jgi:hypothetical protein
VYTVLAEFFKETQLPHHGDALGFEVDLLAASAEGRRAFYDCDSVVGI